MSEHRSRLLAVLREAIPLGDLGALSAKYPGARISTGQGGFWVRTEGLDCDCHECFDALSKEFSDLTGGDWLQQHFIVCPDCGAKRCPKATDHRHDCTGSNEPGQKGSVYA
jgi:hypothetical protein